VLGIVRKREQVHPAMLPRGSGESAF
jgi:hypothetical protein